MQITNIYFRNEQGQTLIEVLAALSVLVVLLTAITVSVLSSLNNATFSKNQNLATQYAQQGIEAARDLWTGDYGTFSSMSGNYCLADTCTQLDPSQPACWQGSCTNNIKGMFTRIISVPTGSPDCKSSTKEIQATVSWIDGKCTIGVACEKVTVTSCFSSNNAVPAP